MSKPNDDVVKVAVKLVNYTPITQTIAAIGAFVAGYFIGKTEELKKIKDLMKMKEICTDKQEPEEVTEE